MKESDRAQSRSGEQEPDSLGGDPEAAFHRLVQEHQDRAFRLALRLIPGDAAAAEDVVQEAFVRAHRALPKFRGDAKLSTWFDRILIREAYRHFRRPWRRWLAGADPEAQSASRAPAEAPSDPLLRAKIEASLGRLTPPQRTAFVLVHMEGYTVNEVAEMTQRSAGTVKSHLHRALTRLRVELEGVFAEHLQRSKPDSGESR